MKILILGLSGQMGTALSQTLNKHEIISNKNRFDDIENFIKEVNEISFDLMINCVALHDLNVCERDNKLADNINTKIPFLLSELCIKKQKKFIHFSTDYVFDGMSSRSYEESDITNPLNYYAISKKNGEDLILKDNNSIIIRVSSLFGKRRNNSTKNFIEKILEISKNNKSITIVSDQIMKPTSTNMVSNLISNQLENIFESNGIYHLCNHGKTSWFEFTKFIFKELSIKTELIPIEYSELKLNISRPLFTSLSTKKIEEKFNFKIDYWEKDLCTYLNEFK